MNSLHAFKTLSFRIHDSKGDVFTIACIQVNTLKKLTKFQQVLCIPLVIDTFRAFCSFIVLQFDEKQYTYTSEKYMHQR